MNEKFKNSDIEIDGATAKVTVTPDPQHDGMATAQMAVPRDVLLDMTHLPSSATDPQIATSLLNDVNQEINGLKAFTQNDPHFDGPNAAVSPEIIPKVEKLEVHCESEGNASGPTEIKQFRQEESVEKVQTMLIGLGYEHVGDKHNDPDGMFGKGTSRALDDFIKKEQEAANLPANGKIDDATMDALQKKADSMEEGSPLKANMQDFISGIKEMQDNKVDGVSALDRVYDPVPAAPQQDMCTVSMTFSPGNM